MSAKNDISQRFKLIRTEWLGLTQDQLAVQLNCSRPHISRVECNDSEYTYSQLMLLQKLCGEMPLNILLEHGSSRLFWVKDFTKQDIATQHHLEKLMLAALELANSKKII